jgi:hypothetical protein
LGNAMGSVTKRLLSSTAAQAHGSASWCGMDGECTYRLHLLEDSATALLHASCTHRCSQQRCTATFLLRFRRCIAVIRIGPSPPFCRIRVRRVLTTSPWCSETPRRSHPWPAGVRGCCAFLPKKGIGLKVLTGHGAELDTTSDAGGRCAAPQTGDVSAAAVWYSTRCEDERSRRIRVPSHRGWCTATGSAGRPITHSGRAWPWRNGGPT